MHMYTIMVQIVTPHPPPTLSHTKHTSAHFKLTQQQPHQGQFKYWNCRHIGKVFITQVHSLLLIGQLTAIDTFVRKCLHEFRVKLAKHNLESCRASFDWFLVLVLGLKCGTNLCSIHVRLTSQQNVFPSVTKVLLHKSLKMLQHNWPSNSETFRLKGKCFYCWNIKNYWC